MSRKNQPTDGDENRPAEATQAAPSPTGDSGRDPSGRFVAGNTCGKGNPHHKRVARLRSLLLETVSDEDFREVVCGLVARAKGDDTAARLLLDRLLGRVTLAEDLDAANDELMDAVYKARAEIAARVLPELAGHV